MPYWIAIPLLMALGLGAPRAFSGESRVGNLRWLTLILSFPDATPISLQETVVKLMGDTWGGMNHYLKEVSYGQLSITNSVTSRVYTMPHPSSHYVSSAGNVDFEGLTRDAIALAGSDFNLADFFAINLVHNADIAPLFCAMLYQGLTVSGVNITYRFVYLRPACLNSFTLAHEMGHALGFDHTSSQYEFAYDSRWDPMGMGANPDSTGVHYNMFHKEEVGWIPASRIFVPQPGTTTKIHLERSAQPGPEGYLIARLDSHQDTKKRYTVEARMRAGYDYGLPGEGIVIHSITDGDPGSVSRVIDGGVVPDGDGNPNDDGAVWLPGETFTDAETGYSISVIERTASGFDIIVTSANLVVGVSPARGGTAAPNAGIRIDMQLRPGMSPPEGMTLSLDGVPVAYATSRTGDRLFVSFQPKWFFPGGSTHSVAFGYQVSGGNSRNEDWSFSVSPYTLDRVHNLIGLIQGSAKLTESGGGHTGRSGDYAIDFGRSGGGQSVYIEDSTILNAAAADDELTYSVWQRLHEVADSAIFWSDSATTPPGNSGFSAHTPWSDNNVYFDTAVCCGGGDMRINGSIANFPHYSGVKWWSDWHHFVFTKQGQLKQVWIDGIRFLQGTNTNKLQSDFTGIWLGAEGGKAMGAYHNLRGIIDDFAVFDKALTPLQIQALASGASPLEVAKDSKLVAYFPFDDAPCQGGCMKIEVIGAAVVVSYPDSQILQTAPAVLGPWTDISPNRNPFSTALDSRAAFFRIRR
jgi:M6 family metalloprotease-like protein